MERNKGKKKGLFGPKRPPGDDEKFSHEPVVCVICITVMITTENNK